MSADRRSRAQRRRDTEHRLTHDIDVWVASASADTSAGAFAPDQIGNEGGGNRRQPDGDTPEITQPETPQEHPQLRRRHPLNNPR
jgi:hypothetical protein